MKLQLQLTVKGTNKTTIHLIQPYKIISSKLHCNCFKTLASVLTYLMKETLKYNLKQKLIHNSSVFSVN